MIYLHLRTFVSFLVSSSATSSSPPYLYVWIYLGEVQTIYIAFVYLLLTMGTILFISKRNIVTPYPIPTM